MKFKHYTVMKSVSTKRKEYSDKELKQRDEQIATFKHRENKTKKQKIVLVYKKKSK